MGSAPGWDVAAHSIDLEPDATRLAVRALAAHAVRLPCESALGSGGDARLRLKALIPGNALEQGPTRPAVD